MITKEELFNIAEHGKSLITYDRMVKACAREVALRGNLYPRKILEGRLKEREAAEEMAAMMAILDLLVEARDTPALAAQRFVGIRKVGS